MNSAFHALIDEVRGAVRFRWIAIAAAWCLCLVGWAVVMLLPSKYEASTRVFVDTRTALSPVIQGLAIQQDVAAHLNLAQEALFGKDQLEKILRETGLETEAGTPAERMDALLKIRESVRLGVQRTGSEQQPGGAIYTISYLDSDRDRGLKVVEMLLDSFITDTLGGKREGSEAAKKFLTNEIAENEQRLRDAEQRLAEFKKRNVGVMPGVEGDYFTRLQNEMDLLRQARADLTVAMSRREALSRQLSGETPFSVTAGGVQGLGGAAGGKPGGADTTSQIADAERRLAALLLRFTEKHPDVIAAREEIARLEQRREEELAALKRGDAGAALSSGAGANPIYQSIQLALNNVDVEIAELRGQIGQHQQKIGDLQKLVNSVPEVEAEFARLNRDYEVTRAQYTALVDRLQKADLGQEAEAASAVRFEVIDPPNSGFQPVSPKRPLLVIAVFVAAVGLGGGLAYLLNMLKPVFFRGKELYEATGLAVLGEVCAATAVPGASVNRKGLVLLSASTAGLVVALGAMLWVSFTYASR